MKVLIVIYYSIIYYNYNKHDLINLGPEPSQINLTNTPLALETAVSQRYFELRGK